MAKKSSLAALIAFLVIVLGIPHSRTVRSDSGVALTGTVSSDAEGPMEGVLVKAKRVGRTITITVVSDERGRYSFPADKLKPGQYLLTVRATGYRIPNSGETVTLGSKESTADLKLEKVSVSDLVTDLMPAEVIASLPGTPQQVRAASGCGGCHSYARILKSTHDAGEFESLIVRMRNHEPAASDAHPIMLPYHSGPRPGDKDLAKYLASINLSSKPTWDFQFKTLPRPKGKATRVIYTEYDLPRPDAEPHDVMMDKDGIIWYIDFAEAFVGRLDPKTGETKEWTLPEFKPGFAPGSLGLALDKDGNPWIARSFQAGIAEFDRKTEKVSSYSVPPEHNNVYSRTSFIAIGPDGKVWFDDTFNRMMYIFNPATKKMVGYPAYPGWKWDPEDTEAGVRSNEVGGRWGTGPNGERAQHFMYGVAVDSKGIGYWGDTSNRYVGAMDSETGKTTLYPTPTPKSEPHRIEMADNDQLWFAEIGAGKVGLFDVNTKQFKEWADPLPLDTPYGACGDKAGFAWAGGTETDFVMRLDPKTGEIVQYLLPNSNTNIRRVRVDNRTNPPSMMIGENHRGKIALIQPLN